MSNFIREGNAFRKYDEGGNMIAEILFPESEDKVWKITRTFVDDSLRGQGVAGKLTENVIEAAKKENAKLILKCSYAVKWFEKHPEEKYLLK